MKWMCNLKWKGFHKLFFPLLWAIERVVTDGISQSMCLGLITRQFDGRKGKKNSSFLGCFHICREGSSSAVMAVNQVNRRMICELDHRWLFLWLVWGCSGGFIVLCHKVCVSQFVTTIKVTPWNRHEEVTYVTNLHIVPLKVTPTRTIPTDKTSTPFPRWIAIDIFSSATWWLSELLSHPGAQRHQIPAVHKVRG